LTRTQASAMLKNMPNCRAIRATTGFDSKQTGHARGQTSIVGCTSEG